MLHRESLEFTWDTPEFEYQEKDQKWYIYLGIISLIFMLLSIFLKNYLFSVIILISTFLIFNLSKVKPETLPVEVSKHGIKIHGEMFPYDKIFSFWIKLNEKDEAVLIIHANKRITPTITVKIEPSVNLMQLREFLLRFIKEKEMTEPFTNKIIDKIKF